ncbi:PREDICTED: geminin coiled-coil domain-containing protein 1 [Propithecus coquereli]|uniref:geminin coiled-coil domain-containing protein 1 n=1 Tax=Propithecus coquereli TaxID=379532 RepID=UPI00063F46F4|nr:PREDICTED: geminin coiled-coil domain-containing protein 1 [Propithecus coquereli]
MRTSGGMDTLEARTWGGRRNTILPCQDQYFVGGQSYNCPYSTTTSESSVDVSTDTWVSFWAAGLLDNREPQQAPQAQVLPNITVQRRKDSSFDSFVIQRCNFQISLPQKLLSSDEFSKVCGKFRKGKRKPKEQRYSPAEIPHPKNAKRSLSSEFANCEEQPGPPVDPWVLQTLGLKDLNTIDDTLSANYSAFSSHPRRVTSAFSQYPDDAADYENVPREDLPIDCGGDGTTPLHSTATRGEDFPFLSQLSNPPVGLQNLPYYTANVSPNKTEMAFSTSLSPHCNVKTHSFHQGQAFVRRDEEGGWKFTWVPKQS